LFKDYLHFNFDFVGDCKGLKKAGFSIFFLHVNGTTFYFGTSFLTILFFFGFFGMGNDSYEID